MLALLAVGATEPKLRPTLRKELAEACRGRFADGLQGDFIVSFNDIARPGPETLLAIFGQGRCLKGRSIFSDNCPAASAEKRLPPSCSFSQTDWQPSICTESRIAVSG